MWESAFSGTSQPVTAALLHKVVLLPGAAPFERVSGAIAVRAALLAPSSARTTLLFLVPSATSRTTQQIVAALMIGNHAHSHGLERLPPQEARALFKGDVLVITPSVVEAKRALEALSIGGQRLGEIWEIVPLTRRRATPSSKPRVLLANPGWALSMESGDRFGAVVVDAAHPRSLSHLPGLLKAVNHRSSIRIVVTPPLPPDTLASLKASDRLSPWLWDHGATALATRAVMSAAKSTRAGLQVDRTLWVCSGDAEASASLARLWQRLIEITRNASSGAYPGLQASWFVYTRLRNLAAPLAQVEEETSKTWAGSLRQRIQSLASAAAHGTPLWDSTFPALCADVDAAYSLFLRRNETAKFWALAARLEQLLGQTPAVALRVVAASMGEVEVLRRLLVEVSDVVDDALVDGVLDIVTQSQDAYLNADGAVCHTLLLGPRVSRFRYLDVLPTKAVEVFVYPFEVPIETAAQGRIDSCLAELSDNANRSAYLAAFGLQVRSADDRPAATARPSLQVREAENGRPVVLATDSPATTLLDLSTLLSDPDENDEATVPRDDEASLGPRASSAEIAEVSFDGGARMRYLATHRVDVYFLSTGQLQRHAAASLQPGWHVICFVDGQYDSLFRRLTEALEGRLPAKDRLAMELWATAKLSLARSAPTKRALHAVLQAQGLDVAYETFTTWFRDDDDDDGVLAPQQFADFAVLARVSGAFPSERLVAQTFRIIQKARGRNRASGRHLRAFLRAVVSGDSHGDAILSARTLDTGLGEVLAAVEVLKVVGVRLIPRSN